MGNEEGVAYSGCRNQNCASAHVVLDPPGNQLFPSEVSRHFDEVTVHIGNVTGGHSFISTTKYQRPNHSSEFSIGSCQCPKT